MDISLTAARVGGVIEAPASKSYAQRAVAAALLSEGRSVLYGMELCKDTAAALDVVSRLGAVVERIDDTTYAIKGGLNPVEDLINIGESGLATRLFTPICALANKTITISGEGSIMNRPVGMMVEPLRELGAVIETNGGLLPIVSRGGLCGGEARVDGSLSSQFVSGLLFALPLAEYDSVLYVDKLKSRPYIDMTISVAEKFGIEVAHRDYQEFYIAGNQEYKAGEYTIEGDWSGASCMLVAGALKGEVTVRNLSIFSKQADMAIIDALSYAGAVVETTDNTVTVRQAALQAFNFDATHCPDLFPALVALAAGCEGRSVIKGVGRLRHKESDRAQTLADVYESMGVSVEIDIEADEMAVYGGEISACSVDSFNDHRIAMSVAVSALRLNEGAITLSRAEAVEKSYPDFWMELNSIKR